MKNTWTEKIVSPEKALEKIEPGMSIFVGTGVAEPRTLIKYLLSSARPNLRDLEVIQLISLGDTISLEERYAGKFRLKTFSSGWLASEAVRTGRVDLIPCRFSRIPGLIESGAIKIDVAFVQITPPTETGWAGLGVTVDTARKAMEQASLVVGEINPQLPRTLGDTLVNAEDFDYLISAELPPITFDRWPTDAVMDKVAANVAVLVENGSCLTFATGALFESLAPHLRNKKNLSVHSLFITDPLMDLIKSGAVTNRDKTFFRGKTVVSYALGTQELLQWLDRNPLIEFQGIDVVGDPKVIGMHDLFTFIVPIRKVDLTGGIAMHVGLSNVAFGLGEFQGFLTGVELSKQGRTICALPSRNLKGESNFKISIEEYPNQFNFREVLDMVVTEYGIAYLKRISIRERALALIDIAHPDDRAELVRQAKEANLIYPDQIYFPEAGHFYPRDLEHSHVFKDKLQVRFRAIKPSDEDQMRRLFYRFSEEDVYYRYFSPVKTMPHTKMQAYVNIDYRNTLSIVGLVGPKGEGLLVAEARYVRLPGETFADVAFIVDEEYQGRGIASYLYQWLIQVAKKNGIEGFTADVLPSNTGMLQVFKNGPYPYTSKLASGVFHLTIPFSDPIKSKKIDR
ncbi:MAG: GNAT family N-acetyltransferase [Thermodesulfobacteriota bacterium]